MNAVSLGCDRCLQPGCCGMCLTLPGIASFLEMNKLSHCSHNWLFRISLLQCWWGSRAPIIINVLIDKLKNVLSRNACVFLGCIDNLLRIYCTLSNMQKEENNSPCSLHVMLIWAGFWALFFVVKSGWLNSEKGCWEERVRKHMENSIWVQRTVLDVKKKCFEAIVFSMDYQLQTHSIPKGFLHGYSHGNLDPL